MRKPKKGSFLCQKTEQRVRNVLEVETNITEKLSQSFRLLQVFEDRSTQTMHTPILRKELLSDDFWVCCLQAWKAEVAHIVVSKLHSSVSAAFSRINLPHTIEQVREIKPPAASGVNDFLIAACV